MQIVTQINLLQLQDSETEIYNLCINNINMSNK